MRSSIPRAKIELELVRGMLVNTGFQAAWLKNPDGCTQGVRWELIRCGRGCAISPACDLCLSKAMMMQARKNGEKIGPMAPIPENLLQPFNWRTRKNVFMAPSGDLFHDKVPKDFILDAFDVVELCDHHNYVFTTKRAHNLHILSPLTHLTNVVAGVSIEGQEYMGRADALLDLPDNFYKVLFLAPMLTHMVLPKRVLQGVDWVICTPEKGGQGRKARPCPEEWIVDLKDQIINFDSNLPFFLDMRFDPSRVHRMGGKFTEVPSMLMS